MKLPCMVAECTSQMSHEIMNFGNEQTGPIQFRVCEFHAGLIKMEVPFALNSWGMGERLAVDPPLVKSWKMTGLLTQHGKYIMDVTAGIGTSDPDLLTELRFLIRLDDLGQMFEMGQRHGRGSSPVEGDETYD